MNENNLTENMKIEITQRIQSDYIQIKNLFPGNGYMDKMSRSAYTSGTVVNVTEYMVKKYGKYYHYYLPEVQTIATKLLKEIFGT